jgi:hypothetical protein
MIVPTEKTFVRDTGLTVGLEYTCIDCMNKEKEEPTHQQRLDKVLSKFENIREDVLRYKEWLYYSNIKNKFWFYADSILYPITISLATVESLLKDLEVE